ncbi:hypothetical protein [Leptospira licerasiae]|uniref:Lipoprotein n=1 Tax=Leptospira licerasiae str. MMD4847 TaxID=1049971 RepID=A0ABP2RHI7_9LEPT|nr:hypothetical protein [Leptospira licerasiae]EIE01816.1 hypothetical protein LEP1GSC185_3028 [Leptospira licerasiae serovar Varillal str. VAR 010]EJZ42951.1 putative lipoprotein [Leptospira licerasiae str. MMD4847]
MNNCRFLLFLQIAVTLLSCISSGGIAGPGRSFPIENQKNTFLILKIEDYAKSALADQSQINKNSRSFFFYIRSKDSDATGWAKGLSYPVNPSHEYFRNKNDGLYKNIVWQFFSSFRREEFLFGCEYQIPMPSGVNEFTFMIFDYDNRKRGYIQKSLDLPENHSVRVKVFVGEDQPSENLRKLKDSQNWPSSYRFLGEQIINLDFQIEKTFQGEEDSSCSQHKE